MARPVALPGAVEVEVMEECPNGGASSDIALGQSASLPASPLGLPTAPASKNLMISGGRPTAPQEPPPALLLERSRPSSANGHSRGLGSQTASTTDSGHTTARGAELAGSFGTSGRTGQQHPPELQRPESLGSQQQLHPEPGDMSPSATAGSASPSLRLQVEQTPEPPLVEPPHVDELWDGPPSASLQSPTHSSQSSARAHEAERLSYDYAQAEADRRPPPLAPEPPSRLQQLHVPVAKPKPDGTYDVFIVYSPGRDAMGRSNDVRAAAVARGLLERGLAVRLQGRRAGGGTASSDDGHVMAEAAAKSACAVLLLTRKFIERVGQAAFGDTCLAGFVLAKRLPNTVVVAMEPELANQDNWGWNPVYARLSGKAVADLSADEGEYGWHDGLTNLACVVRPDLEQSLLSSRIGTIREEYVQRQANIESPEVGAPPNWRYDCFLSHTWAKDRHGRDNHGRVLRVAQQLRRGGLSVFFDEWEMHRYRSIDEAMVDGMRSSAVVVIFVTRDYIDKVETGAIGENCVAEFNLAKRAPRVVPVIMERDLRNPSKWGWNRLYAHLSGQNLLDLSHNEGGTWAMLFNDKVQRWLAAINVLELRIRGEHPCAQGCDALQGLGPAGRGPPFVPLRDVALLIVAFFAIAGLIIAWLPIVRLGAGSCGVASVPGNIVSIFAYLSLTAGFSLLVFWYSQLARLPPRFDVNTVMLPRVALAAAAIAGLGSFVLVVRPVASLVADSEPIVFDFIGSCMLFAGAFLALADASLLRLCNTVFGCSVDLQRPFSFENLPGWAAAVLCLAAFFLLVAKNPDSEGNQSAEPCVLELLAGCTFLLSTALGCTWVAASPRQLRWYYGAVREKRGVEGGHEEEIEDDASIEDESA